jgi:hypothetical protein
MRLIRSFFFGGFAMLAAVMCLSMPARAFELQPGICTVALDLHAAAMMSEVAPAAIITDAQRTPMPSENSHAVAYRSQNQPFTSWRFAVDAYTRIDPDITIR